jgi:hypothetical protein
MPLAFSFFSSKNPAAPSSAGPDFAGAQQVDANASESSKKPPSSPFPVNSALSGSDLLLSHEQQPSHGQNVIEETFFLSKSEPPPLPQPERRPSTCGLAALVLSQSDISAPPLNKRLSPPPAAALASEPANPVEPSSTHPSAATPTEVDALKQEFQAEIEQVKNDLFGAVMGVSALKDRLDGIESQVQQTAVEPGYPSRSELETWVSSWLETHLGEALERTLGPVLSKFSTQGLLRTPLSHAELQATLSQPPVILTSTPL